MNAPTKPHMVEVFPVPGGLQWPKSTAGEMKRKDLPLYQREPVRFHRRDDRLGLGLIEAI